MENTFVPYLAQIGTLKSNEENPRDIDDIKFKKLVTSVKSFPEMLNIRPIIIDENNIILGGNMRYRACIDAGISEVPVMMVDSLTEEQKKEFTIKDNISYGVWNWSELSRDYDSFQLDGWALDLDPSMFNISPDKETGAEAKDSTKFHDYTIFFASDIELEIWYEFIRNLRDKFSEHDNTSERILRFIAEIYNDNDMLTDSQRILKVINYGLNDK